MQYFIGFIFGVFVGAAVAVVLGYLKSRQTQKDMDAAMATMRDTFKALAGEALVGNSQQLRQQATEALDSKKELIDQSVKGLNEKLSQINLYFQQIESQRQKQFGQLSESAQSLAKTTGDIHKMLASHQRRGAWGERMAEDIIRLAGLIEHVNYAKQVTDQLESNNRPDFMFNLPNDLKVSMDVKFPIDEYKAFLDSQTDQQRKESADKLCATVKKYARSIASKGYIDPKVPTVDYLIMFVPSEQVVAMTLGNQPDIMDELLSMKVVLASPLTLYALLCVIRQAAQNANLMKKANIVLDHLRDFTTQWEKYSVEIDKLGKYIDQTSSQYEIVSKTRTRQLERVLEKIDELSVDAQEGIADE